VTRQAIPSQCLPFFIQHVLRLLSQDSLNLFKRRLLSVVFEWRSTMSPSFYRVDYLLAVIFTGFLIGAICRRRASMVSAERLARGYYIAVVTVLFSIAVMLISRLTMTDHPIFLLLYKAVGDVGSLLFGALFGLSLRRPDRLDLFRQPFVLQALCLAVGFTFALGGVLTGVYFQGMSENFTQWGYSVAFLKFIMTIEVLGGIALLVPWAVPFAAAGLSIDMFGSIVTHFHNGDPLNDCTGAISHLIRLTAIAVLWALQSRSSTSPARSLRRRLIGIAVVAVISFTIAACGGRLLRRSSPAAAAGSQSHF
jgi:uncharacterized membrane protein YphA (DoxX/SURF4 family)